MDVRLRLIAVAATGSLAAASLGASNAPDAVQAALGASRAGCDVTEPQLTTPPGGHQASHLIAQEGLYFFAGETGTYAALPPRSQDAPPVGTYPLYLRRSGNIKGKVPWFRDSRAYGRLEVTSSRRSGGDEARGDYSNYLGRRSRVVPGAMKFTRPGCWDISATSGDATLEATVRVIEVR